MIDVHDTIVAYIEYQYFNDCMSLDVMDFVQMYFMGQPMGYTVLYAVDDQLSEICSYIPKDITSLRFARTIKDAFYVIGERNPHPIDVRFNPALEALIA